MSRFTQYHTFLAATQRHVTELLAADGYATEKILAKSFINPQGIAVDSSGNLFVIADAENLHGNVFVGNSIGEGVSGDIYELHRSQPSAFVFPTTTVGTASSPQTATVQNIGNATLTASSVGFTDSADFSLVAGSGTPEDCSATFSLAASAECNLNIEFTPQSLGALSGSVVLTDNAGNAIGATQSIALSGTGVPQAVQVSLTILQFGSIAYPGSATQPLTIDNVGSSTVTIDPSSNGRGAIITGNTCGAGLAAGKSCILQVEFKPVQLGLNTNTLTIGTNIGLSPKVPVRGTATGVARSAPCSTSALSLGAASQKRYPSLSLISG